MNESMDIAFLLVTRVSTNDAISTVTWMISSIANLLPTSNIDVRLAAVRFILGQSIYAPAVHSFTSSMNTITQSLISAQSLMHVHSYVHYGVVAIRK